jgi:O-antigen ligase
MAQSDNTTLDLLRPSREGSGAWLVAILIAGCVQLAAGWWAIQYQHPYIVAVPLIVLGAIVCFSWPRAGLFILTGSWFLPFETFGIPGVYPADAIMMIVAASYVCGQLVKGNPVIPKTRLNGMIAIFMAVYALSLANAVDFGPGVKSWFRHLQLFVLFIVVAGLSDRKVLHNCLALFLVICCVVSVPNILGFLQTAGRERVFGPAGIHFSGFLAVGAAPVMAFALLERRSGRRLFYLGILGLFIFAQIANQSRGAMIQLLSGVGFVVVVAWLWDRRHGFSSVRRRILAATGAMGLASILMIVVAGPQVGRAIDRYTSQSGNERYTLQLREFLWGSAFRLFLQHPVLGTGPAQSVRLASYLPELRFDPSEAHTRGLGVHNSILQYLAEAGILGSVALAILLWRAVSLGKPILRCSRNPDEAAWEIGVWGAVFVIVSRYLYEGHLFYSISGMTTVTFLAYLSNINSRLSSSKTPESHQ